MNDDMWEREHKKNSVSNQSIQILKPHMKVANGIFKIIALKSLFTFDRSCIRTVYSSITNACQFNKISTLLTAKTMLYNSEAFISDVFLDLSEIQRKPLRYSTLV